MGARGSVGDAVSKQSRLSRLCSTGIRLEIADREVAFFTEMRSKRKLVV
jgi:hypothetical protein